ncbi:hypothetical protein GW17_00002671 [Ensete ventricosum]|nr:hypothetical protein GW17_00002671 [Ensete ventricosum]
MISSVPHKELSMVNLCLNESLVSGKSTLEPLSTIVGVSCRMLWIMRKEQQKSLAESHSSLDEGSLETCKERANNDADAVFSTNKKVIPYQGLLRYMKRNSRMLELEHLYMLNRQQFWTRFKHF